MKKKTEIGIYFFNILLSINLIQVPHWWDGKIGSLVEVVSFFDKKRWEGKEGGSPQGSARVR
jgi:hypothetical protein